jgi:hypothetical protein
MRLRLLAALDTSSYEPHGSYTLDELVDKACRMANASVEWFNGVQRS